MLLKFDIKFCKNKNYWKISLNPWTVPRNKTVLAFSPWKLGQNELESWTKHWHQFGEIVSLNCRKNFEKFQVFFGLHGVIDTVSGLGIRSSVFRSIHSFLWSKKRKSDLLVKKSAALLSLFVMSDLNKSLTFILL